MARVVGRKTDTGLIVAKLAPKPHPDTCWCRPWKVADEAWRKRDMRASVVR
jgi:hypothetical protein